MQRPHNINLISFLGFYETLFYSVFYYFGPIGLASDQAHLPKQIDGSITVTQHPNGTWLLDCKLGRQVSGIMFEPPTPEYHAQAWHLPDAYAISINPQMGFCFLEPRDKSAFTDVSFLIKT